METNLRGRADTRLDAALGERGLSDSRDAYRGRLRALRDSSPALYERAAAHYEQDILPELAERADPVETWIEYGRFLAELTAPGRTVTIDASGRAQPYSPPLPAQAMVVHLPDDRGAAALALATPAAPSPQQQATYSLLVLGRLALEP